MIARRCHYEMAFEHYLHECGTKFVAVEEVRRTVPGRPGIKMFDYLVYPGGAVNVLVDVKGRKQPARVRGDSRQWRCWVTRGDVEGMAEWQRIFGGEFEAAFVFAYWLVGGCDNPQLETIRFAGRDYTFKVVRLADYQANFRSLSTKWKTVFLATADFERVAAPPAQAWGGKERRERAGRQGGFTLSPGPV